MLRLAHYDALERQREKQRSRDRDDRDLQDGRASMDELAHRNSFFSGFAVSHGRIGRRGSVRL